MLNVSLQIIFKQDKKNFISTKIIHAKLGKIKQITWTIFHIRCYSISINYNIIQF